MFKFMRIIPFALMIVGWLYYSISGTSGTSAMMW